MHRADQARHPAMVSRCQGKLTSFGPFILLLLKAEAEDRSANEACCNKLACKKSLNDCSMFLNDCWALGANTQSVACKLLPQICSMLHWNRRIGAP